jgi:hypothetical protein
LLQLSFKVVKNEQGFFQIRKTEGAAIGENPVAGFWSAWQDGGQFCTMV